MSLRARLHPWIVLAHLIPAALLYLRCEVHARYADERVGYLAGLMMACGMGWHAFKDKFERQG